MKAEHQNVKQAERILGYMREFGSITPLQALADIGCFRLGARIFELKEQGYKINRRMVSVKNRYGKTCSIAEYSLAE